MIVTYINSDWPLVALTLLDENYKVLDVKQSEYILNTETNSCLVIDTNNKTFNIKKLFESEGSIYCSLEHILNKLGVNRDFKDQYKYIANKYIPGHDGLLEMLTENKNMSNTENLFIPGRLVTLLVEKKFYIGIILTEKKCACFNTIGHIEGYIDNLNLDDGTVLGVYQPTSEHYKLKEYDQMTVIYKRQDRVKKTISEIEQELGLAPGTLEIKND